MDEYVKGTEVETRLREVFPDLSFGTGTWMERKDGPHKAANGRLLSIFLVLPDKDGVQQVLTFSAGLCAERPIIDVMVRPAPLKTEEATDGT